MSIWDTVLSPIVSIINKLIPDKAAAAAAVAQLQELALQVKLQEEFTQLQAVTSAQSDVDKVEAANSSMFVAGWRPAIGWVCGIALAFQYLGRPLIQWGFAIAHQTVPALPGIDDQLWQLMFGLLGMGALRSFDKLKGTASTGIK
jgi:hypothetical protein